MVAKILSNSDVQQRIRAHLRRVWSAHEYLEKSWPSGPILRTIPHFRVGVALSRSGGLNAYTTIGCFSIDQKAHTRHEFFILSPWESQDHLETLAMLANYHADARFRLGLGRVVGIGGPWMPGSLCDHFLISLPYTHGPNLEWLRLETICIRFLWALPITSREAAFAELHGFVALEEKFEEAGLDYLNPNRQSIV